MYRTNEKKEKGITLVALVVTIVVLLILAGITITYVMGDNSVFKQTQNAKLQTEIAKAREKLEITFGHAKLLKHTDNKYDQDDYLDDLMEKEILNIEINDDIVIVDGYVFEIDRSEPKIGEYRGEKKDLVFPEVTATATIATDNKQATINITAKEEKNGISRIEIWLLGEKIKEYTYDKVKTEITVDPPYIATQNGEYKIKAYAVLGTNTTVNVTGVVASVKFEPNKNDTWQQTHTVKATIQETGEEVVKAKYLWTDSVNPPEDDKFPDAQTFKSGDTITGGNKNMTGTYYLWTMLETKSNKTAKWRSEGFNFDNKGPEIESFKATKKSESKIELSIIGNDDKSGIKRLEFYVDEILKYEDEYDTKNKNLSYTHIIEQLSTGKHKCKVVLIDWNGNDNTMTIDGETMLFSWNEFSIKTTKIYSETWTLNAGIYEFKNQTSDLIFKWGTEYEFDKYTGTFKLKVDGESSIRDIPYYAYMEPRDSSDGKTLWQYRGGVSTSGTGYYVSVPYDKRYSFDNGEVEEEVAKTPKRRVTSEKRNAYPNKGKQDGFWYEYFGVE